MLLSKTWTVFAQPYRCESSLSVKHQKYKNGLWNTHLSVLGSFSYPPYSIVPQLSQLPCFSKNKYFCQRTSTFWVFPSGKHFSRDTLRITAFPRYDCCSNESRNKTHPVRIWEWKVWQTSAHSLNIPLLVWHVIFHTNGDSDTGKNILCVFLVEWSEVLFAKSTILQKYYLGKKKAGLRDLKYKGKKQGSSNGNQTLWGISSSSRNALKCTWENTEMKIFAVIKI